MKVRSLLALAFLAPIGALAQDSTPAVAPVPDAVKGITAKELGGHMRFLASDLMRGRDTASSEIRLAAEYLSSRLYAAGAEPVGDPGPGGKSYFQAFPLEVVTANAEGTTLSFTVDRDGAKQLLPCVLGSDFSMFPRGVAPGDVDAPVVFAGKDRGSEAELKEFADIEVKNRFVLLYQSGGRGGNGSKSEDARKRGALGLIYVPAPTPGTVQPTRVFPSLFGRPSMTLGSASTSIPMLNLGDSMRDRLFGILGAPTGPEKPGALEGVRAHFTFAATKESKQDRNVFGIFPGSDPEKKKEVIVFSAHYDHVGVDEKGEIFNGSDDNASGTSALLEIAEAIGEGPRPARTIVFLWVSGEEKGLWGSSWFADHSPLPSEYKIVADINLDMVSRNDGKQVGITPSPKHGDYSNLIPAAQESLKAEGIEALFNADEFYARTDSFNFAKKGIPVIFFFSGIHADYHKSTDDVDKADFDKAAKIARAAYRLGYQMAQAADAPQKIKAPATEKTETKAAGGGK